MFIFAINKATENIVGDCPYAAISRILAYVKPVSYINT